MRRTLLLVVSALCLPQAARADGPSSPRQALAVTVGYSSSNVSPRHGALLAAAYSHRFAERWSWLVQPELVLNPERPEGGSLLKGGAFGLDGGLQWASAEEGVRLVGEASLGLRLFNEPGLGAVSRLAVGVEFPLAGSLSLVIGVSGELGAAKIGDERPVSKTLLRGDLWTQLRWGF
jgi:hypothetical protein